MDNFNAGINTAMTLAQNEARDAYGRSLLASYGDNLAFTAAIDGIVLNAKHEADANVDYVTDGFPTILAIKNLRASFDGRVGLLHCKRLFEASNRRNGWTGTR